MHTLPEKRPVEDRDVISHLEWVDTETGETHTLQTFDHCIEAPNWTRDGQSLVFNAGGLLYRYALETGDVAPIPSGYADRCNNDHVLSPDGRQIAISHHTAEDGQSRVYVLPFEGGVPALITPIAPSYLHGWSPDGRTLAYCAERNGEYDIYAIPAEGGEETRLTDAPGLSDGPEYTPDGEWIWFNSVRSGLMQLYRMRPDGSGQTRMTDDNANSWFAHISPDNKTVAYIAYRAGDVDPGSHPANRQVEIRLMPAQGGPFKTLVSLFGGQGTLNVNSWAPDSRRLAYVRYALKG
ncbi:transporter [Eubacteriales bacterium OttesenSCG-928-A19]|nr:transporter [Eubacteriales bacterium OttesenSCG-928-A19]